MLFFSCKVEGRYFGKANLAKAFLQSRNEAETRISKLNDALCEEIDEGKCAFISRGNSRTWRVIAAFNEREDISVRRVQNFFEAPFKECGGMENISVTGLHEITAKEFQKELQRADDSDYLGDCRRALFNMDIDFYASSWGSRAFGFREELQTKTVVSKKAAVSLAREILADSSLLDELDRIYSKENVRSFHGHPVHYKVSAGNQNAAMAIVRLLTGALYARKRLFSRRISLISEITEGCFDDSNMTSVFKYAPGSTVVMELRGSNEEHANYATAYEKVTDFIAELVAKHHQNVLCVFIEYADNPGFTPSLMSKVEEHIDVIEISEGAGNREEAANYLRRLVKAADFEVMDEAEIEEALEERLSFTSSDIYRIYGQFYKDGMKNKLYRAYKTAKYVVVEKKEPQGDAYARLQKMVGLSEVKRIVKQIIAAHKVQKMRSSMGLAKQNNALHMLFTGNPGSAKTTVARLLADILKKEGVLESGAFVECGRSDLVGQYVGWTAPQVKRKFRQARGGILFIDEAYSLVDYKDGCYGDEAISTIVQEMENHRDSVIVIFAGYTDKMKAFLDKNEGLRSRIVFHLDFPDYDADELTEILSLMAEDRGFTFAEPTRRKCRAIFVDACRRKDFGNGRFARNLLEQAVMKQSQRIMDESKEHEISREEISELAPEDFEVNAKRYGQDTHTIGFCG